MSGAGDGVRTHEYFGVPVRVESLAQAVTAIERIVDARQPRIHVVLNAAKVSRIDTDPAFLQRMREFDLVHADGASIVLAGRLLGRPLPERVAGIDLMTELVGLAARRGYRPFLLGARRPVVEACADALTRMHPGLHIAGIRDGYWDRDDPRDEESVVRQVRDARPDLLFVAMPTPAKEEFLHRHRDRLGVPFSMGVGGAFDVLAGLVTRAPRAWQRAGMEWAYRLLQEPRKMWRRYLVTNSRFLWLLTREVLRQRLADRFCPVRGADTSAAVRETRHVIDTEVRIEFPAPGAAAWTPDTALAAPVDRRPAGASRGPAQGGGTDDR